ncbi:MAG TPA: asparaginase [Candidatus Thermoplasmatota archaeon]|nr:asparaginase [Candidatus Thermoplasmatota archaeon]
MKPAPVGVEIVRGDVVESVHRVHVVVVDGAGSVVHEAGDASFVTYLRSAAKPFQAVPLVTSGAADAFGLTKQELALCCGSHSGEPLHVETAARMLEKGGVSAALLQCGTHAPRSKLAKDALKGGRTTPLHHNCSGKHAGMMLLQKHLGGDPADYWQRDSAAQQAILRSVAEVAGMPQGDVRVGTDGCSAPNFALPLSNAALLFARLAMPQGVAPPSAAALARLRDAMVHHPEMVGGGESFDTDLMGASDDRLVAKAGAEGCEGVGDLRTGMGLFLKAEDGAGRPVPPATIEALRQLAWLEGRAFEVLGTWWMPTLTNWSGRVVGRVKPVLTLGP